MSGSDPKGVQTQDSRVSRRAFLKAAGAGTVLTTATSGAVLFQDSTAFAQQRWTHELDVVVVGSGSAASSAALFAHEGGASVLMLEKAAIVGGTTAKSGGMYWIPNNYRMHERGMEDDKQQCLRFMARLGYPTLYDPMDAGFGVPPHEFSLMEAFYDNAAPTVEALRGMEVGDLEPAPSKYFAEVRGDRYPELAEHSKTILGRALHPSEPNGTRHPGNGPQGTFLISQFKAAIAKRGIPVLLEHRATRLILNAKHEVIGLEATNGSGQVVTVRARKGVIFGTGGFTANAELCRQYLRGPIFGGCAAATNEGDFIYMAGAVGAKMGNMSQAWWGPVILEQALQFRSVPAAFFSVAGDSVIQVNREGRRPGDEKRYYNDRTQVHFYWDPNRMRYPNLIQMLIYDQRCREKFGGERNGGIVRVGVSAPHLLTAQTLDELAQLVDKRLEEIADKTGNFRLDPDFMTNLKATIARFNGFAETGVDVDFHRGHYDNPYFSGDPTNGKPNPMMYPIAATGPYYAVLIGGGTLDTKGGPVVDTKSQVLNTEGKPIPGLYGAGNCIASPAGQGYWSGGGTIGPALTFGALAGKNAAMAPIKAT